MEVRGAPGGRVEAGDLAVGLVGDDERALAEALLGGALPPGQDRLVPVCGDAQVRHGVRARAMEPDRLTAVVDDERTVLLPRVERPEEEEPARDRAVPGDVHHGRAEIGSRDVVVNRVLRRRQDPRLRAAPALRGPVPACQHDRPASEQAQEVRAGQVAHG